MGRLETTRGNGGSYLLDGRLLHAGAIVEAAVTGCGWIPAQFECEWDPERGAINGELLVADAQGRPKPLREYGWCRWPVARERCENASAGRGAMAAVGCCASDGCVPGRYDA